MATDCSILAWKIPQMAEPGESMKSPKSRTQLRDETTTTNPVSWCCTRLEIWAQRHREGKTPRGEKSATGLEGRECRAMSPGTPGVPAAGGRGRKEPPWSFWGMQDPPNLHFRLLVCRSRR